MARSWSDAISCRRAWVGAFTSRRETGDFFAKGRLLPPVSPGDTLAVFTAGAYAMSMASNYNDHARPPEVLIDGSSIQLIRERETVADMVARELAPRAL